MRFSLSISTIACCLALLPGKLTAEGFPEPFVWRSEVPEGCPFESSPDLTGVRFTGRYGDYHCGDTIYPSWAADGNLYTPWTDGTTDGLSCKSGYDGNIARTGHAVIRGEDPLNLEIRNTSPPKAASAWPYLGRYPTGSLVHEGIWYYGTYCLGPSGRFKNNGFTWNWPNLGPMPGFQISRDLGKTWEKSPHSPAHPLFPEPEEHLGPVKMGAPHFVDFGKNMEHSPDGMAYLVAMGALRDDPLPRPSIKPGSEGSGIPFVIDHNCTYRDFAHGNLSWISADQIYLARVIPSSETINDLKSYEFFAGHDGQGKALWTGDFSNIRPLLEWNNHLGAWAKSVFDVHYGWLAVCIQDGFLHSGSRSDHRTLANGHLHEGLWRTSILFGFSQQVHQRRWKEALALLFRKFQCGMER